MNFYTLPQSLYTFEGIHEILSHGNNCILHKILKDDIIDAEALITSHSIVYVIEGRVQINTYDGEEIHISKGDMLFMPRDSYVISDYVREGKDMEVYLLFFDHDIALKFLSTQVPIFSSEKTLSKLTPTANILAYFEYVHHLEVVNKHNKDFLELKLLEFLHLVIQNDKEQFIKSLQSSEQNKKKRDIEELMEEYLDKNLTIGDYAALSGRSLSSFNRAFKQKYEKTPKRWLIEKKMQKSVQLLEAGKNVTDTAFEVGYHNVSHFIRAYKSVYDETPKVMQKKL